MTFGRAFLTQEAPVSKFSDDTFLTDSHSQKNLLFFSARIDISLTVQWCIFASQSLLTGQRLFENIMIFLISELGKTKLASTQNLKIRHN